MWVFFNYASSLKHPEDHFSLICSINISATAKNVSAEWTAGYSSHISVELFVFFIVLKHNHSAFQLILSSWGVL